MVGEETGSLRWESPRIGWWVSESGLLTSQADGDGGWVLFDTCTHQIRQRGDAVGLCQAIMQVGSKADAQFAAGFLETYKRVAATTAQVAAGSGADLSQPSPLADVVFGQIVVQRQMGIVQDGQELISLGMQQAQRRVQVWIGCLG